MQNIGVRQFHDKIQGDQKVSVHLVMYCNRQVHGDFLIILYNNELYTFYDETDTVKVKKTGRFGGLGNFFRV
jgi:hypothetical protein